MDFEPLSDIFQEVDHIIRASDPRLCRIDISVPGFLAREDIVQIKLPSQQALPEPAAPREETTSSRLSLKEEIDQFQLKEEEEMQADLVKISNSEGELDRSSITSSP